MTHVEHNSLIPTAEDIYDDGFLRVEHKNYYVACGGSPIKLPRTEFLIFSRLTRTPNRIVASDELWSSVWGTNKPLNTEVFTSTSIACGPNSPTSDCKSKRWLTSATG